ncbi:putative SRSF protein kinase 2-like [Scophthalmus maximus]|uniref:Putative SRSF protein kinase 2-like n=1 Tax=Scophthalmus maximus TaxID=52904 RepID=A0A2U9BWN7_SCOMX|nr:putative SRSF protein kinase 2-like [Scophthalmus maximus]
MKLRCVGELAGEPEEEILGSDDEEQEDPADYCKGQHGTHKQDRPGTLDVGSVPAHYFHPPRLPSQSSTMAALSHTPSPLPVSVCGVCSFFPVRPGRAFAAVSF